MQVNVNLSYFSKKVVTQFVTTALTYGAGWVVLRYGFTLTVPESALVTSAIAWVAGGAAGWWVKETTKRVLVPPVKPAPAPVPPGGA